jgi:hypothetical protein
MPETPGNARLEDFLREEIPRLAILYDRIGFKLRDAAVTRFCLRILKSQFTWL